MGLTINARTPYHNYDTREIFRQADLPSRRRNGKPKSSQK